MSKIYTKGNLKTLASEWSGVPKVEESIVKSHTNVEISLINMTTSANQIAECFSELLDATISFFTEVGISFLEADDTSAKNIGSLSS